MEGDPVPEEAADVAPRRGLRPLLLGAGVGLAVGLLAAGIAVSVVAIPMFALASFEPGQGLDRSIVRTGLFQVALPLGVGAGLLTGVGVGIWYARGGRLPTDRTPIHG